MENIQILGGLGNEKQTANDNEKCKFPDTYCASECQCTTDDTETCGPTYDDESCLAHAIECKIV